MTCYVNKSVIIIINNTHGKFLIDFLFTRQYTVVFMCEREVSDTLLVCAEATLNCSKPGTMCDNCGTRINRLTRKVSMFIFI